MKTEILVVLDRSGSMSSIATETIGGFNTFIDEQKKVEGKARVTLAQFDNIYEVVYQAKKLKEVPLLDNKTFVPRGYTALLDAIGNTILVQKARIDEEKWADKVILVILTDGGENASKEISNQRVKELTKEAQDAGWSIVYLGANQDSFEVATSYGINTKSANNAVANFSATGAGVRGATMLYSTTVTNMRTAHVPEVTSDAPGDVQ